eukprot:gene6931-12546_t
MEPCTMHYDDHDDIYLHTRSNGHLYQPPRLRAKTKVCRVSVRELLLTDDGVFVSHSLEVLQRLMDRFGAACTDLSLIISTKKTRAGSAYRQSGNHLQPVLGPGTRNTLLRKQRHVSTRPACCCTYLYGSETWTTYTRHERKLNPFHMRNLRRIICVSWKDHVTNQEVLTCIGSYSIFHILKSRRMRWLGRLHWMEDGRLPKDILYG